MNNKYIEDYRPDLDGLRALAIILVLVVHMFPMVLQNGYIGVDIFFVISGFLITKILINKISNKTFSLSDFYIRRINRIFPCLIMVLIACLILGWLSLFADEYKLLGKSVASSAAFVANINNYAEGGYWDVSSKVKPLLHLWSLGVEEQFYTIWPMLLWLAVSKRNKALFFIFTYIVLSFAWNIYITKIDQPSAYYLLFSRLWELASGGGLAYCSTRFFLDMNSVNRSRNYVLILFLQNICSILGVLLIILSLGMKYPQDSFPGLYAVIPVVGVLLVILAGPNAWINSKIFSNKIVVYIGLISYPLYMWHYPLIVFNYIIQSGYVSSKSRFVVLGITFLLAIITYHVVEKPIRGNQKYFTGKALILLFLLFMCGVAGYFVNLKDGFEFRYKKPELSVLSTERVVSYNVNKVVVLGDSQGDILAGGMQLPQDQLKVFSTAGWPYLVGTKFSKISNKVPKLTDDAIQYILSDKKIDIVVITNMYNLYTDFDKFHPEDRFYRYPEVMHDTSKLAYYASLRRTAKIISDAGKKVIYVKSIPFLGNVTSVSACANYSLLVTRTKPESCLIPIKEVNDFRSGYDSALNEAFKGVSNIYIFDPIPYLCDTKYCYVTRNNLLMYRDSSHLSSAGAKVIGAGVLNIVDKLRLNKTIK